MSETNISDSVDAAPGQVEPSKPTRTSSWTCRLPSEIMGLICEDVVWDRDQQSLSRLQSTSSAMYTMVTPYFFRHTRVNQHMAIVLFSLFNGFPKTDNNRFLHPIPEGVHLVDLHPAYRLRKFFSHMVTFSVYLREDLRLLTRDHEVECDR